MKCSWADYLPAVLLLAGLTAPLQAQGVRELGLQATATAADPGLAVAGLYGALRTSTRVRLAATLGAGRWGREAAWRGELLATFHLNPASAHHLGFYAGGGVAVDGGRGTRGYAVLLAGMEAHPGARSGWAVELGAGGGVRLAVGWRWRWFPKGWRPEP